MFLTISAHNYETFEDTITVSSRSSLVRLIAFNTKSTPKGNLISWTTKSDGNVDGFNLYRKEITVSEQSSNGKRTKLSSLVANTKNKLLKAPKKMDRASTPDPNNWIKVNDGLIKGRNPYHYLDQIVSKDRFEYRLEAVAGEQSIPLTLENNTASVEAETRDSAIAYDLKLVPNPAKNMANLAITVNKSSSAHLNIYDLSGRTIKEVDIPALSTGVNSCNLNLSALSQGIYILQLTCEDGILTRHFLVSK